MTDADIQLAGEKATGIAPMADNPSANSCRQAMRRVVILAGEALERGRLLREAVEATLSYNPRSRLAKAIKEQLGDD